MNLTEACVVKAIRNEFTEAACVVKATERPPAPGI